MCGLSGILGKRDADGARDRRVRAMSGALAHRGPDAEGAWADDDVALGFRRLAVIDLATGDQPIRLEDDRAVIVLNGEIYNYRELRAELSRRGHVFRTQGDVEVALRVFADDGVAGLRRLNGMFAFAIWDRRARRLYLGRDRHGIKPLFYCVRGAEVAFASEVGALLAGGYPAALDVDPLELRHVLAQKYPSPAGSLVAGIEALPPATVLEIAPDESDPARRFRRHRYWEPPASADSASGSARETAQDLADQLERRLRDAVRRQLVADVPLGVFLSGGVDSGTLTALVKAALERDGAAAGPVRTFSVGFEGEGSVSELPAAREAAAALGTEHHELVIDARDVARDLDAILGGLDGPLADPTAIPTWYMSRHARSAVTVALSGEGADELFGGYPRHRYDAWLQRAGAAGRALLPAALRLRGRPVSPRLARRLRMPSTLARQLDWSRLFDAAEADAISARPLPGEDALLARAAACVPGWDERARRDPLGARLEADRLLFLPGDLLPKVDRMSMAHGLEVRVPFLDDEVVDFVVPLPGGVKVRGARDKALLRDVAARVLPGAARRRKQGFFAPIGAWLRGPLREPLLDRLAPDALRASGLFRPGPVQRLVQEHLARTADHGEKLWALLVVEGWWRTARAAHAAASWSAGCGDAGTTGARA